ncbi:hypothetical protein [Nocardioides sp. CF8]|uniref:hypothetical protein n=1 Tax=Nocardioides sp. CF8 TaxID=110319 RepID=UPI0012EB1F95|nr:hypothetical protein [Nocardioides sp. CF8]
MILSTARQHGRGPTRLPDRIDRERRIAAIQVETDAQAEEVLRTLDRAGRRFYLDVERKQDLHLMETAAAVVRLGERFAIKPNDITVDALVAVLVEHFGPDLTGVRVAINGSGNLGFKFALRLAESGCAVFLVGRDMAKTERLIDVINTVLPAFTQFPVAGEVPTGAVHVLVSAVTAEHVITPEWLGKLAPAALCLDVGINNLSPSFIEAAIAAGHICSRVDVRSAGDPLPVIPNPFFAQIAGRREFRGVEIVAGGLLGNRGDLVVDQMLNPTLLIGIANGTGGLLSQDDWTAEMRARATEIEAAIVASEA